MSKPNAKRKKSHRVSVEKFKCLVFFLEHVQIFSPFRSRFPFPLFPLSAFSSCPNYLRSFTPTLLTTRMNIIVDLPIVNFSEVNYVATAVIVQANVPTL